MLTNSLWRFRAHQAASASGRSFQDVALSCCIDGQSRRLCRMLEKVARKRGWESVRKCADAYWDRLSEGLKRDVALHYCEKSFECGATINAVTQIVWAVEICYRVEHAKTVALAYVAA
jgi:hypothetical protein